MESATMATTNGYILGTLLALNFPVYLILGKIIFKKFDNFADAVVFWLTPDTWSLFRGRFSEDLFAEIRLGIWFALCAGAVLGEYTGVMYLMRELNFL